MLTDSNSVSVIFIFLKNLSTGYTVWEIHAAVSFIQKKNIFYLVTLDSGPGYIVEIENQFMRMNLCIIPHCGRENRVEFSLPFPFINYREGHA